MVLIKLLGGAKLCMLGMFLEQMTEVLRAAGYFRCSSG